MITPSFPDFKKLELGDENFFYSYTKNYPPYSDFNFVSLWSNDNGHTFFSILNNNLVLTLSDYITGESIYSFLGKEKIPETVNSIFDYLKQKNIKPFMKLLPEDSVAENIDLLSATYTLKEDFDNFDYVLSTKNMAALPGQEFRKQRNLLKQLKKQAPDYKIIHLDLTHEDIQKEIIDLCNLWGERKNKTKEEIEIELSAIKKLLKYSASLNLVAIGLFVESALCAFFISEIISKDYAIGHFRKADTFYHGIFASIDSKMAEILIGKSCRYFNFEQDLGIEKLRRAKQSWHPAFFLKKYTLSLKP